MVILFEREQETGYEFGWELCRKNWGREKNVIKIYWKKTISFLFQKIRKMIALEDIHQMF